MKEKKIKILWSLVVVVVISLLLIVGSSRVCYAIAGSCSNCHTMHNSQGGDGEVETYSGGTLSTQQATPQNQLLKASCIACHVGTSGATNSHDAPIVLHTTNPTTQGVNATLAGGDFYWVATGLGATDSKGHNVAGINSDDAMGKTPPGWATGATPGALSDGTMAGGAGTWLSQLTCAGMYGCHGNHSVTDSDAAMSGAHHGNTGGSSQQVSSAPGSVGASYRFLGGIWGLENSQWNWAETAAVHNEYMGKDGNDDFADKTTISYACAQCHGDFHSTAAIGRTASPWLRHPTDIVLPTTAGKEYSAYNPDGTGDSSIGEYCIVTPVARGAIPSSSSATVTEGATTTTGAVVMCLSCHRAHGSPEDDLLRWTYDMVAGSGTADTGCFTCHTTKNAD